MSLTFTSLFNQWRKFRTAREEEPDAGFTLIELMVVLLIIAILLAIAIPTYLGIINSANDRSAQSNLGSALQEAIAFYLANGQSFAPQGTNYATMDNLYNKAAPEYDWTYAGGPVNGCTSTDASTCIGFKVSTPRRQAIARPSFSPPTPRPDPASGSWTTR